MSRSAQFFAIAIGLTISLLIALAAFGLPIGESLRLLAAGAFGDKFGIARTIVKACPLLLTGLGMVVAWRAGMYNIGGEGQFLVGGLCAAAVFRAIPTAPSIILSLTMVMASACGGAAYAWFAGWLHVKRGVQVVISTILLNFIALQILGWLVAGPLREKTGRIPQTDHLTESAMFVRFDRQTDLHLGVFLAPIAAILVALFLFRTVGGFKLRLVGENTFAARAARFDSNRIQMRAMSLSGALCGLAAACDFMGVTGVIDKGFSQQWGFLGIPVALVGGLNPIGAIGAATYFGALFAGSDQLARFTQSGATIVYVIQAVAVLAYIGFKSWTDSRLPEASI